ncbi:SIR2 family protein [Mesorhizobium amorphae]|uniref:P-loop NTPase n=1 Tax=Mesorhizobium amorphae TaxID=71433 RepID=UPI001184465F|nr:SIR2 family protein [Mesorhizobium amorphae]
MLKIENEASLRAALKSEINLFVGAGFSILAKDKNSKFLPIGSALSEELCSEFNVQNLKDQPLPLISQIIKSKDKIRFNEFLMNRHRVKDYDERYNSLNRFPISRIFTTNIDNLFSHIYSISDNKYLNDLIVQGASFRDKTAVEYLPLHGSVNYPEPDFTFTPIELASAFANNPTQFQYLVSCLRKAPTLFLGYSLQDAGTLQSLNYSFTNGPQEKSRWIQLRSQDDAAEAYFKSLGFNIVQGDTDSLLDYLSQLSSDERQPTKSSTLHQRDFESGRIPLLHETPVRPIVDYFRGHAPTWHDVLTNRVPRTSRYAELINHIDANRNVLVAGIPVSGKSTLLMQAAAYYDTAKIKLFEDFVSPEKATSLVNKVSGKADVILFIDNVADCVDSLDVLANSKNIQIVGADRSVNIGFGSHRFNTNKFLQFDCSDLSDGDYSKIFEAIPPAIRRYKMEIPNVNQAYNPSTFEFIEKNVQGQTISDRYKEVLQKLRGQQIDIHDLFVMICYAFSCHSPVSFDVVSRYCELNGDYKKVYEAIDRLGTLLADISPNDREFVDLNENQDYFTPRSSLVAETVVEMCRNEDFRRMYLRFHNNVPRLFIPRFSNFRRYGYRSGYAERVFKEWQEGEAFYLRAYQEDRTYFLKQQLAIFLGSRKQFQIAFKYIDEALTESHNRNPNVRHTHARLLFDANIDKAATDISLRNNLRKSMEILESCHEYDKGRQITQFDLLSKVSDTPPFFRAQSLNLIFLRLKAG